MSAMIVSNQTRDKFAQMFSENKRFDGRKLTDYRNLEVSFEVSNKAEGSAKVKLGKTEVIAGVKLQLGEPYPDSPEKGNLMVSGDLLPLASPRFESGPPGFDAIELPRLVDRAIRESGMIDFKKLVVVPKEKVWTVIIDIYPLNDDGNLIDAATIAAVLALKKARIPSIDEDGKVDYKHLSDAPIPLSKETLPLSFSVYKLGDNILLDPTREEEEACDGRITWGLSLWNGQKMFNSCQKRGEEPLTQKEIETMMEIIPKAFDDLIAKLKNYL